MPLAYRYTRFTLAGGIQPVGIWDSQMCREIPDQQLILRNVLTRHAMAPERFQSKIEFGGPATYRIIVQGKLDEAISDRLGGMGIVSPGPEDDPPLTILLGELLDQAALSGVLNTLYEMHMPILAVEKVNDHDSARRKEDDRRR
jgi:hypothetical protein